MAFNFNWSPLIADTNRVRDMLTSALNKPNKPPIIVDDIYVNELNLGSTPPSLEILEIGDLAEDRFRGIFKMSYTGDAYLTLKTKVQINPLKTFLSTKPPFTSPQPLAACSGLTMPVQITLSAIRLSGFVILVFSKQKGITLVFRNDPLESLKVSSTFDSIPFVRDFLQNTIEKQLRTLFVEDLPAIIHSLSLKVFNPELSLPDKLPSKEELIKQAPIDPFASPALNAMDGVLQDGAAFSLDIPNELYATFSQKNILRLAALSQSQRTLSLFTPGIRDTVYRAWTMPADRGDAASTTTAASTAKMASLSRIHTSLSRQSTWSSTASETSDAPSFATRPSLMSMNSAPTVYSLSTGRPRAHRKKKHRVVDLRKKPANEGAAGSQQSYDDGVSSAGTSYEDSKSVSGSRSTVPSHSGTRSSSDRASQPAREGELTTPPKTPERKARHKAMSDTASRTAARTTLLPAVKEDVDVTPRASMLQPTREADSQVPHQTPATIVRRAHLPRMPSLPDQLSRHDLTVRPELMRSLSDLKKYTSLSSPEKDNSGSSGGILEQAWMNKIAGEVARKIAEEKAAPQFWHAKDAVAGSSATAAEQGVDGASDAPPAYAL